MRKHCLKMKQYFLWSHDLLGTEPKGEISIIWNISSIQYTFSWVLFLQLVDDREAVLFFLRS